MHLTALNPYRILQLQKKRLFASVSIGLLLLVASLLFRFIPVMNDALSGRPHYMQAFTAAMGRQIAGMVYREYPVLVLAGSTADCHAVNQDGALDSDDSLYVLTYSEETRSLCLSVFAELPDNARIRDTTTFTSGTGYNYGRDFSGTIHAVPLHRNLTVLSPQYLALLHWRAKVDPATFVNAGKSQRVTSPSAQVTFADASISFVGLRAEVAKRHDLVNRVLISTILLAVAELILFPSMLIALHRRCATQCRSYDFDLSFRDFLRKDLAEICKDASALYQRRRRQLLGEMRLENTLRRERKETRLRLEALLSAEAHNDQHLRIERALHNDDLDQMHNLLLELQPYVLQKSPEERLRLLLESLKEYCGGSELQQCEREVLEVLQRDGFRQARETVIHRHDQFRARFKRQQAEQQTLPGEPNSVSDLQLTKGSWRGF